MRRRNREPEAEGALFAVASCDSKRIFIGVFFASSDDLSVYPPAFFS
jgi:hypothetical protein